MSGHAVNCFPIKMKTAMKVYEEIDRKISEKYPSLKKSPIGSYGKKAPDAVTGDIDIAVEIQSKDELVKIIMDSLTGRVSEINMVTTPSILSIAYEYNERNVQVDFMLCDSLEWALWRFDSPDLLNAESKYKADPKVFLMTYMVSALPCGRGETLYFDDGTVRQRNKYTLNQKGLFIHTLNYMGKKGKPVKHPTKINEIFVSNDPKVVMDYIYPITDRTPMIRDGWFFKSVERLWRLLHCRNPFGSEYVEAVEKRFYEEYINNPKSECKLDPADFPCMYYKP